MSLTPLFCASLIMNWQSRGGDRERFFAKDMNAGTSGANGEVAMHVVWKGDVNGIDQAAMKTIFVFVAGKGVLNFIFFGELAELVRAGRNEGGELRVACVFESGKNSDLRDVAEANDGITDPASLSIGGLVP